MSDREKDRRLWIACIHHTIASHVNAWIRNTYMYPCSGNMCSIVDFFFIAQKVFFCCVCFLFVHFPLYMRKMSIQQSTHAWQPATNERTKWISLFSIYCFITYNELGSYFPITLQFAHLPPFFTSLRYVHNGTNDDAVT